MAKSEIEKKIASLSEKMANLNKAFDYDCCTIGQRKIEVEIIPSGVPEIDKCLGSGGWPTGSFITLAGEEGAGKTTVAIATAAEFQKRDKLVAVFDMEDSFNQKRCSDMGFNTSRSLFFYPECPIKMFQLIYDVMEDVDLFILDSIAAIPTPDEESSAGLDTTKKPRLFSDELPKMKQRMRRLGNTAIWTNQLREKPGMVFGDPQYSPGGRALRHFADIRARISRKKILRSDSHNKRAFGQISTFGLIKNKVGPNYQKIEFPINYFGWGQTWEQIIDRACAMGVIEQAGSWYKYNDQTIGQGIAAVSQFLHDNQDVYAEVVNKTQELYEKSMQSSGIHKELQAITLND